MRDKVEINKELIPYSFNIMLEEDLFELEINYNSSADLFTVSLYRDEMAIIYGEPLVYGVPLFTDVFDPEQYPVIVLIPLDESGQTDVVKWDNFNTTVFLCIDN